MSPKLRTVSSASETVGCWLNSGSRAMLLFCSDSKVIANVQKAPPWKLYGNKMVSLFFISWYKEIVKPSCKGYFLLEKKCEKFRQVCTGSSSLSQNHLLIREQILRINLLVIIKLVEDIKSRRKSIRQSKQLLVSVNQGSIWQNVRLKGSIKYKLQELISGTHLSSITD